MDYDMNAPLWTLTIGEFTSLIATYSSKREEHIDEDLENKYSYGLKGLADLLGCSKTTAWKIKESGKLGKAIKQEGRKIVIDNQKALELFGKKRNNQ